MPTPLVKKLALSSGQPIDRVEHLWDRAKKIVKKEYGYSEKSGRFWKLVHGITKKMLSLNDSAIMSFFDYVRLDESVLQYINEEKELVYSGTKDDEFLVINVDRLAKHLDKSGTLEVSKILLKGDSDLEITLSKASDDAQSKLDEVLHKLFGVSFGGVSTIKPGEYTAKFSQKILVEV